MNWPAIKTSASLSLLFLIVYGGCNWITAHRHDVGTYYFEWERHIPFVPTMIVPYMSIDLFFVAAPFLCKTDRQRRTLRNRIISGILIAGACFLILPLRFAFDRPHVDGLLGAIFNGFRALDQPFNQLPSLHIVLRTILAVFYASNTRGILHWLARIWFSLIGFSTILTYQHHVIDVLGGFALAALCIYLWQDRPLRMAVQPNYRIGSYYAAGAIVLTILGILAQPFGFILLWPATSFAIVAAAYFAVGPGIYRKWNGELPVITRLMLWPILLGQRASLRHYARQCEAISKLDERVWIGRMLSDDEARQAVKNGVSAVLDLTGEFAEVRPFRESNYLQLPIMDLTAPIRQHLEQAIAFIADQQTRGIVYIHCKAGYSRTAAIAGAYLLAEDDDRTVEEVVRILKDVRPAIVIRPEIWKCLEEFSKRPRQPARA